MLPENRALLLAGALYWVGLFVLFIGFSAAVGTENHSLAGVSAAVAGVIWIAAIVLGTKAQDRYGKVRTGIDRGR